MIGYLTKLVCEWGNPIPCGQNVVVWLGYRKEGQENEDKNDLRLVFEIERVGQLFNDYKKVKLKIWRTFTDTTMEKILDNNKEKWF